MEQTVFCDKYMCLSNSASYDEKYVYLLFLELNNSNQIPQRWIFAFPMIKCFIWYNLIVRDTNLYYLVTYTIMNQGQIQTYIIIKVYV